MFKGVTVSIKKNAEWTLTAEAVNLFRKDHPDEPLTGITRGFRNDDSALIEFEGPYKEKFVTLVEGKLKAGFNWVTMDSIEPHSMIIFEGERKIVITPKQNVRIFESKDAEEIKLLALAYVASIVEGYTIIQTVDDSEEEDVMYITYFCKENQVHFKWTTILDQEFQVKSKSLKRFV